MRDWDQMKKYGGKKFGGEGVDAYGKYGRNAMKVPERSNKPVVGCTGSEGER